MALTVDTIYFEGFAVTPAHNFKTGELGSALIVYTVTNIYQQVAHGEVRLAVTFNGAPLEKILLLNLDPLLVGKMGVPYSYTPTRGWQQGTYGFSLQLYIDGQIYTSSKERNLTAGKTDVPRSRKGPRRGILGMGKSGKAEKLGQKAKTAESKTAAAEAFSVEDAPEEDNAEDTAAEPSSAVEAIDITEAASVKKNKVGPDADSTAKKGKWWKRIGGLGKKREDRGHVSAEVTDAGEEAGGEEEEVGFAQETDIAEQTVPSAAGSPATENSVPEASEAPEESPATSDAAEEIAAIGATVDVKGTEEPAEAVDAEEPLTARDVSDLVRESLAKWADDDVKKKAGPAKTVATGKRSAVPQVPDAAKEVTATRATGDAKERAGIVKAVDAGERPTIPNMRDFMKEYIPPQSTGNVKKASRPARAVEARKRPTVLNMSDFMKEYTPPQSTGNVKKASGTAKAVDKVVDAVKASTSPEADDVVKKYVPPQPTGGMKETAIPAKAVDAVKHAEVAKVTDAAKRTEPAAAGSQPTERSAPKVIETWKLSPAIGSSRREGIVTQSPSVVKGTAGPVKAADIVKRYVPPQPTDSVKETASPVKASDTVKPAEVARITDAAKRIEPAAAGSQPTESSAPKVIEPWKWAPATGGSRREGIITQSPSGVKGTADPVKTADVVKKYVPPQSTGGVKETAGPAKAADKAVDTGKPPTAPKVSAAVTGGSAGQASGAAIRNSVLRFADMGKRAVPPAPGGTVGGQAGRPAIEAAEEARGTRVPDAGKEEKIAMTVGADKERVGGKPDGIDKESAAVKPGDAGKVKAGGEVSGNGQKSTDGTQVPKGKDAKTTNPIRFLNR